MEFQVTWFILWAALWAIYFMLDGFDFGVGILLPFLSRGDQERRVVVNTIGPVWDGNEVWLITAGGATFAAFPTAYALMFSYLYSALLIVLFALIVRGVALEFRSKHDHPAWRAGCDSAIFAGSFIPSLLFGVAFGNIFRGLPMDASGYHGTLLMLLNPYGLLTGLLFVSLFIQHGSIWIAIRTSGALSERARGFAQAFWYVLAATTSAFLIATALSTKLPGNYVAFPLWFIVPALSVLSMACTKVFLGKQNTGRAFVASCLMISLTVMSAMIGLYPNLLPSSIDPGSSLTIFNASSSPYTLRIMTVVALLFVPIVAAYQFWIYRVFLHRISLEDLENDKGGY